METTKLRPSGKPMVPEHWKAEENRLGKLLLRFRKRNQWAGQTAEDWAKACPELWPSGIKIANSVWTNLETGKSKVPALVTFEALGRMNELLASDHRGRMGGTKLRKRVYEAEPITGDDGRVWTHHDFIDLYLGKAALPEAYASSEPEVEPELSSEEAAEACERITLSFREYLAHSGLNHRAAIARVVAALGESLKPSERDQAEEVLLGLRSLGSQHSALIRSLLAALTETYRRVC